MIPQNQTWSLDVDERGAQNLPHSALLSNSKPTLERAQAGAFSTEKSKMNTMTLEEMKGSTGKTDESVVIKKDSFESSQDMLAADKKTVHGNSANSNAFMTTFHASSAGIGGQRRDVYRT